MKYLLIAMCIGCMVLGGCGAESYPADNPKPKTYTVHCSGQTYRNLTHYHTYHYHSIYSEFKTPSGKLITFSQTFVVEEE